MRHLLLATALAILSTSAAHAQLRVCNDSDVTRSLAIGYSEGGVWTSEGWWVIAPGDCALVRTAPLTQRFVYWRATTPGQDFEHENFMFCVSATPFTIVGDTDCEARGYKLAGFRSADTGTEATEFTLRLPVMGGAPASADNSAAHDHTHVQTLSVLANALPAPVPAQGDAFLRGQQGEPFTQSALMQSCTGEGPDMVCMLHAEGWRYAAFAADAPEPAILDALAQLAPNTPVIISGDILYYGDITAEVILSRIEPGPPDPLAQVRALLQGAWVSVDDPAARIEVLGTELVNIYNDETLAVSLFVMAESCPDGTMSNGTAMGLYELGGDPDAAICWGLDAVTDTDLIVMNLPRGNILTFRRP